MILQQSKYLKKELSEKVDRETIDDILIVPPPFSRKTDRKYKQKKFGAMTDKQVLEFYENNKIELEKIEQDKRERKEERELKKAVKLNEMKIKKEKVEAKKQKQNDAPKNEPKKRGRPRKTN